MDYTELETAVKSWLNRNNFTELEAEIPTFFELAQERIERDPQFKMIEAMSIATVNTGTPDIPAGFSKAVSYTIPSESGREIHGSTVKEVQKNRANNATGIPKYVAPIGTQFYFAPAPSGSYDVEVVYIQRLTPVSPTNATNILSNTHPSLILFATLVEACLWLKDDSRAKVWEGRYQQTIQGIAIHEEYKRYEGGALQVREGYSGSVGESVRFND